MNLSLTITMFFIKGEVSKIFNKWFTQGTLFWCEDNKHMKFYVLDTMAFMHLRYLLSNLWSNKT